MDRLTCLTSRFLTSSNYDARLPKSKLRQIGSGQHIVLRVSTGVAIKSHNARKYTRSIQKALTLTIAPANSGKYIVSNEGRSDGT